MNTWNGCAGSIGYTGPKRTRGALVPVDDLQQNGLDKPAGLTILRPAAKVFAEGRIILLSSQSLRVLAVDDEPLILMNLVDMLEDLGHEAVSAGSGKSAIVEMEKGAFDLLVTDHSMPNMTGADLIRQAREKYPQIAVILATGHMEVPEEAGGNVVRLGKPFSTEDLVRALQAVRQP